MDILSIVSKFDIEDRLLGYFPLGNGHINTTYLITTKSNKRYVLQKINTNAFKDVDYLMDNIYRVTQFLDNKGYLTLQVVKTKKGQLYYDDEGDCYRVYEYIDNVICYEGVNDLEAVYSTGKAFGILHKSLSDFPAETLFEVIPDFHNTQKRYNDLLIAINSDKVGRVKTCTNEIQSLKKFENEFNHINHLIARGEVKLAVTHNDPKINNILFDKFTNDIKAVVDLDTVMPGSYLYDYGDALRSLFTGQFEDSKDLSNINIDYAIFEMYTKGYLSEMKECLTHTEVELLPFSIFLLSAELAIRFLTDYINGDEYFKVNYDEHNLVRARTQIKLAVDVFHNLRHLGDIVKKCYKNA